MKKNISLFILAVLSVMLIPLGVMEFFSPDETRYAQIAREMIRRCDYVTPTLNGVRYFEKPVLGYWCQALSMKIFGENEFAVRFPSALAVLISALCIFLLARRFAGGWKTGLLSSGFFLLTPIVFGLAHIATLDSMLSSFLTLGMTLFYFAMREKKSSFCKAMLLFLCGGAFGGAFLVKGFLAFAVGGIAILPYLIVTRRWKKIFSLPWIPILGVLAAILPWAIAIHLAEPDYWNYFFWEEHVRRFFGSARAAQHHEGVWFFIPVFFAGLGYLVLLLPAVFSGVPHWKKRKKDLMTYAFFWFVMPFLFFSASSGKLPTYILPCFAPVSLLAGRGIFQSCVLKKRFFLLDLSSRILACALPLAVVVLWSLLLAGVSFSLFSPGETWKLALAFSAAGCGSLLFVCSIMEKKDPWKKIARFALGFLPVLFVFPFLIPEKISLIKTPVVLLKETRPFVPENAALLCFRYPFQDVCWVFDRSDITMYLDPGEIEIGMKSARAEAEKKGRPFSRIVNVKETNDLIRKKHGKGGVLLVLPNKIYLEEGDFPVLKRPKDGFLPDPSWIMTCACPGEKLSKKEWFSNYRFGSSDIPVSQRKENAKKKIGWNSYSTIYFE